MDEIAHQFRFDHAELRKRTLVTGDNDLIPGDLSSYSSRVTSMTSKVAIQAAGRFRGLFSQGESEELELQIRRHCFDDN